MKADGIQIGVVSEAALALELGLSRDGLAEMRKVHCVQGVDWELVKREVRLIARGG